MKNVSKTGKASFWKVPPKRGHLKYTQDGGKTEQEYSQIFQVPENLKTLLNNLKLTPPYTSPRQSGEILVVNSQFNLTSPNQLNMDPASRKR